MAYKPGPPTMGLNHVGAYQVSGQPYISGSTALAVGAEEKYTFPYVSRTVTVVNLSSQTLRVHFNSTGSGVGNVVDGVHFMELDSDEDSYTFTARCKEVYVSNPSTNSGVANFRVVAELTGIDADRMYALTGSGLTE